MKKKLMFLALGVLGLYASSYAQPPSNTNGVLVNGAPVAAGAAIGLNSVITFNGMTFMIIPIPDMQPNDGVAAEQAEQNLTLAFINQGIVVDLNTNGTNNSTGVYGEASTSGGDGFFGFDAGNFTLQVVPFDFGISAVLGAGALAAVKTARKRRKEEAVA